ncbi:uncharacterized protein [Notothenia coriiceps]|uniref:Uncharacterized protein n=1 Tax=Notothenia coriiceps TaxID=8208 RepID=A0A6I9MYC3_9TELE|nr:PREDICTED: uncharacterized protein LOC104946708 [Notothenia coriiceps]
MKVLKGALLLLLLAVANSKPDHHHDHQHNHTDEKTADPDQCQVLQMLAEDNLQQVLGDWVLVWAVSDHQEGQDILKNLSSSRVEMRLQEDNQTLMFTKRNLFSDNKFLNYHINISMELLHNPNQTMHPIEGKKRLEFVLTSQTFISNSSHLKSESEARTDLLSAGREFYLVENLGPGHLLVLAGPTLPGAPERSAGRCSEKMLKRKY